MGKGEGGETMEGRQSTTVAHQLLLRNEQSLGCCLTVEKIAPFGLWSLAFMNGFKVTWSGINPSCISKRRMGVDPVRHTHLGISDLPQAF